MKKTLLLSISAALCAVVFGTLPQSAQAADLITVPGGFDYFVCGDGTPMYCGEYDGNGGAHQVNCSWEQFGYAAGLYCEDHGGVADIVSGTLVTEAVEDDVAQDGDGGQDIQEAPKQR
ncbi:MAG: hypothetical protein AAGA54_27645 [Myxococcota bacterium]